MKISAAAVAIAVVAATPMAAEAAGRGVVPDDADVGGYVASMSDRRSTKRLVIACSREGRALVLVSGRGPSRPDGSPAEVRYSFDNGSDIRETWKAAVPRGSQTDGPSAYSFVSMLKEARSHLLFAEGEGAGFVFSLNGGAGRVLKSTVAMCQALWEKGAVRT